MYFRWEYGDSLIQFIRTFAIFAASTVCFVRHVMVLYSTPVTVISLHYHCLTPCYERAANRLGHGLLPGTLILSLQT